MSDSFCVGMKIPLIDMGQVCDKINYSIASVYVQELGGCLRGDEDMFAETPLKSKPVAQPLEPHP